MRGLYCESWLGRVVKGGEDWFGCRYTKHVEAYLHSDEQPPDPTLPFILALSDQSLFPPCCVAPTSHTASQPAAFTQLNCKLHYRLLYLLEWLVLGSIARGACISLSRPISFTIITFLYHTTGGVIIFISHYYGYTH
eukprot:scaffold1112_cov195-Alexandrium_tamarense.AAC.31